RPLAGRGGMEGPAPWKRLSKEELEDQYSPSRWVIRRGAEEALRTYSHIGDEEIRAWEPGSK
uniref:Arylformamidase n=1 Tax=Canis lupus dingo TaxID=286419 RepID=A0A8C0K1M0_CANLU